MVGTASRSRIGRVAPVTSLICTRGPRRTTRVARTDLASGSCWLDPAGDGAARSTHLLCVVGVGANAKCDRWHPSDRGVLAAFAVALFGLQPRLAPAAWGMLTAYLVLLTVGATLQLNQWLLDLSPFSHIPKAPAADVSATPLVWLVSIAVVLTAAGLSGLRRRDIPAV
jgi:putative exporter of polyketide antibiotics